MDKKPFTKSYIHTIAAVVPKKKIPLLDFAEFYGEKEIERISKVTGIEEVTVADEDMTSSDYCFAAALKIFEETGISASDIDGLIFLSESPDYIIPNTAAVLQNRLGIRTNTINIDLRYGCAGYVYGLFQASMLIESGYCRNVLLLAGDTMSKFTNQRDRSLKMVLGDAACATLITSCDWTCNTKYSFYVDGSGTNSLLIPAGGCRMPIQKGVTDILEFDEDGNGRTKEDLYMNGMDIMVFAMREVPKIIKDLMTDMAWTNEDVDLFAFHQANKMMVSRIAKTLKVSLDKVPINMLHTGNCGFVSVPLMLCNTYEGINKNFEKVIMCGFGAGLIAAAAAVNLSNTKIIRTIEV